MKKSKQISLLERLEEEGLGIPTNISPWLFENFLEPSYKNKSEWEETAKRSSLFIDELVAKEFINSETSQDEALNFFPKYENINEPQTWYSPLLDTHDNHKNNFWITVDGIDYLDKYNLSQISKELALSNKELNDATLKNLKTQRRLSRITIVVAGLAALFSFLSYIKPEPKMAELNTNIRLISTKLEVLSKQIDSLRNHPTSPKEKSHK